MLPPTELELLKQTVFIPCKTKEALKRWIYVYLGIDLPDCRVDPSSTSSPMDCIWEIYSHAIYNYKKPGKYLAYASRDSFKTLGAGILELLALVHMERSVVHLAAIEAQSKKAREYVNGFLHKPLFRDYIVEENARDLTYLRYRDNETGENFTEKQYIELLPERQVQLEEIRTKIEIVVCTMQSVNSKHSPFMVVDEVDVVEDPSAYEDAKFIPSAYKGRMPITLLTSTRKFSIGLVQKEIDNSAKSGMQIRHWNIIDVTQPCPTERHRPDLPRIDLFYSEDTLDVMQAKDHELLTPEEQSKFEKGLGYHGCYANCKIFAMCQGRLATDQKSTSNMLKDIEQVTTLAVGTDIDKVKAQLLCWMPSKEGLIYPGWTRTSTSLPPRKWLK
jgi:hypothetical protein